MELTNFIQTLISTGTVSIKGVLIDFTKTDLKQTILLLEQHYQEDILEMPYRAPAFLPEAALWAAEYFYMAVQLTVLRDEDELVVKEKLKPYPGPITHESIYSVDLVFRHLKSLFDLAKGLAPADILVEELKRVALQWPFSCVGMGLEDSFEDEIIFSNPSLKQAYIDRLMERKDTIQVKRDDIKKYILESTGEYTNTIWPGLEIK